MSKPRTSDSESFVLEAERKAQRDAARERRMAARKIAERSGNRRNQPVEDVTQTFEYRSMTAEQQIEFLQSENQASLQRSIQAAEQANEVGATTMVTLATQREQLEHVNNDLQVIEQSMDTSERLIRGMKSWAGAIKNAFSKPKPAAAAIVSPHTSDMGVRGVAGTALDPAMARVPSPSSGAGAGSRASAKRTASPKNDGNPWGDEEKDSNNPFDKPQAQQTRKPLPDRFQRQQDIEDQQLERLSHLVQGLKVKGEVIGQELDTHLDIIKQIDDKMDRNTGRIENSNQQLKKMLS